jgi:hypothetical protein
MEFDMVRSQENVQALEEFVPVGRRTKSAELHGELVHLGGGGF